MVMNTNQLKQDIRSVFDDAIESVRDTDDQYLNETPSEGGWTPGQVAEHIVICSRGIPDNQVATTDRNIDKNVTALSDIFLNMEEKTKAAPQVTPGVPPHHKRDLIAALEANKGTIIAIINNEDLGLLCLGMEFPYMGYLTRYEWLHFVHVHTRRHVNQLNNTKRQLKQADRS